MNNIQVRLIDMPTSVKGCVVRHFDDDVFYTIMINSRLSSDVQKQTYLHEIDHIEGDDFSCGLSVDCIERIRHSK